METATNILIKLCDERERASKEYTKYLARFGTKDDRTVKAYQYYMGLAKAGEIALEQIELSVDDKMFR